MVVTIVATTAVSFIVFVLVIHGALQRRKTLATPTKSTRRALTASMRRWGTAQTALTANKAQVGVSLVSAAQRQVASDDPAHQVQESPIADCCSEDLAKNGKHTHTIVIENVSYDYELD